MRFRVLHKQAGETGFICQVKVWWGWRDLGIMRNDYHLVVVYRDWAGTLEEAKGRLNSEVDKYQREQAARRAGQEFKPKVIEEWP